MCVCVCLSVMVDWLCCYCRSSPGHYASLVGPCSIQRVDGTSFTQRDFELKCAIAIVYVFIV